MLSRVVLAGILCPILVYLCIGIIIIFVLSCALYVCALNFRQFVKNTFRKLKLLYWPENPFRFLGLPPEIRVLIYTYMFPMDGIYYMTAIRRTSIDIRHLRKYSIQEAAFALPSLLSVNRLVYQELRPMLFENNIFAISIYSITDLLRTLTLLESCASSNTDIFASMKHIRLTISCFVVNLCRSDSHLTMKIWEEKHRWHGPGERLLVMNRPSWRNINTVFWQATTRGSCFETKDVRMILECFFKEGVLCQKFLENMLPWYLRRQKAWISPV